jgi:hypothetical protein
MMKMMSARRAGTTDCDYLNGSGKQQDQLKFHHALQRFCTTLRPLWFDVFCGDTGRLIDQCGDKRAQKSTKTIAVNPIKARLICLLFG